MPTMTKTLRTVGVIISTLSLTLGGFFLSSSAAADTADPGEDVTNSSSTGRTLPPDANACGPGLTLVTVAGSTYCSPSPRETTERATEPNVTAPKATTPPVTTPAEPAPQPTTTVKPGCVTTGGGTACGGAKATTTTAKATTTTAEVVTEATEASFVLPQILLIAPVKVCLAPVKDC